MYEWSEDHQAIINVVRSFIDKEIRPHLDDLEHGDLPPYDILRKMYATFGLKDMAKENFAKQLERKKSGEDAPAARRNADYQAQVANMNANIAKQNSEYETQLGEQKAYNQGLKNRAAIAGIETSQAANGLDVNSGSNLATRMGAEEIGMTDVQTIKTDAARQSYNYQVQATQDTEQSALDRAEGAQAEQAGIMGAFGSLLSSAGMAAYFSGASGGGGGTNLTVPQSVTTGPGAVTEGLGGLY